MLRYRTLFLFVCSVVLWQDALCQYKVEYPSADLKNLLSLHRIGDTYYAMRTGAKYTYLTFDKNFKTIKSATDRQVDDSRVFRLGNNMYILTAVEDKKKGTLDFFYATYLEPTKTTLLKSYNLKLYKEGKFFDAYKEQFTGTEIVNTASDLNFHKLFKVGSTPDYQHLVFSWLNPDSVYTLNYQVTVYDKDFKTVKEQSVSSEGTFSFHSGEKLNIDHRGNVYFYKHSLGNDDIDFARYNFNTGETVTKVWAIDRVLGHEQMRYRVGAVSMDTLSGETCVLFFLSHSQSPYSVGASGVNTTLDVAYVNVYDRNGGFIKRNSIKLSKTDRDSLKIPGEEGLGVPLSMTYPTKGEIYRYSNGNYAVELEFANYKTRPLDPSSMAMQTDPNASANYYNHSNNNYLVRVYGKQHEQIKEYNIYRRRVRDYSGYATGGNDVYWLFYQPPVTVYNPRESEKGMLHAYYIDKDGEIHTLKMEGGKFVEPDLGLKTHGSDTFDALPMYDDDTHQTVFLRKK